MTDIEHYTFRVTSTDDGFEAEQPQADAAHVGRGSSRAAAIIDYCERYTEDSNE